MTFREEVRARLVLDPQLAAAALEHFVRDSVDNAGARGVVVGLSGGVASALSAALAARALGPQRVQALFLPYRESDPGSKGDAEAVAAAFGLALRTIGIAMPTATARGKAALTSAAGSAYGVSTNTRPANQRPA